MGYKSILVHLDLTEDCAARARQAIDVALHFNAQLVGLAICPALVIPGTGHTEVTVRMLTEQWERYQSSLVDAAAKFERDARIQEVAEVESRVAIGEADRVLCLHARYADLLIIGQAGGESGDGVPRRAVEHVVLDAGRPVLIIPYTGSGATLGERVLVAWNASREATRALTDALPLLQRARSVDVVTVNAHAEREGHGELPGADVALYLARHSVRANVHPTHAGDVDVGEWLLSRAADLGTDLIVMGAYGHSRFREMVLGGTTRTMLASMTVPVLMAH
jgi:nucleotide-binding universal stress UspA family protein